VNLHYGCGLVAAKGWFNCDASPTLRLQRLPLVGHIFGKCLSPKFPEPVQYGDIVKGLPLPANSCAAVYCCHVLEHLSLEDCRTALCNTNRYLKPGGLFRCVQPDFEQQVATYLGDPKPTALQEFLKYTFLGRKTRPKNLKAVLRDYLGNSHHLWMWDYKGLAAELEAAGFRNIRRCQFGDSCDPAFEAVEIRPRYEWALAIECTK
jgi:SAM-dependent methyltransferase